ncbi:MAG: hypothetical protein AB1679_28485 [Actinomycetota bacterium]
MPRFRRAAAAATLSLLTLAACGGGEPASKSAAPADKAGSSSTTTTTAAPTPLDLVLASSDKVADTSTMRFTMTMGVPQGSFTAEGAMDTRGPLMSMTMDMASLIPPAERKAGTKVEMVLTDQAMYMQYPGLAAETGGKHWLRFDLATLGEGNPLKPMIDQMREADPSKNVAVLEGAQDVTTVGAEDVRGVATTHYKFTVDLRKAMSQIPENLRTLVSDGLSRLGTTTMPAEVWLDADGLPRRMAYEMSMSLGAGAPPMTFRVSMDMFDFGQPVTVTPPADNDVVDGGDLFGALEG